MNAQLDLLTLIALVVAAAAIFKLRSVLGHRSDEDDARVQRTKTREREAASKSGAAGASGDVINMPRRERSEPATAPVETISESSESRIRSFSAANPAAIDGLLSVAKLDNSFDPEAFLTGAGRAYEMIVTAFAQGDRKTLKDLLSRDVYDGFVTAIGERDGRGEKIEQSFVGIKKADIAGAEVQNGMALVTVRFVSELITALRGSDGEVISGDPLRVSDVTDVWTFSRDVSSPRALDNPNWKLEETQPPN